MSDNKFKDYMFSRQWNKILGDFVSEAEMDSALPDPKSWEELEGYLIDNQACDGARRAAEDIWKLYIAHTRGQEV